MMRLGLRASLAAVCMGVAMPAMAQNLLQNPRFDGTLDPWLSQLTIYDTDHTATADGTGSAAASVPNDVVSPEYVLRQCVSPIVPGATYPFGGTVRIPSAQSTTGRVFITLDWFTASDCSDQATFGGQLILASFPGPTDSWETLTGSAVAPPGTTSASFYITVDNDNSIPPDSVSKIRREAVVPAFAVSIDDPFLTPPIGPTPIVPALGGTGLALLVASVAGAGYFVLRR